MGAAVVFTDPHYPVRDETFAVQTNCRIDLDRHVPRPMAETGESGSGRQEAFGP